ncbi:PcfJ domain-containing protein [uncultured Dokdonia sp.]|uniref:PcfJ domain-containing protein n=1 Tax=uncultured Dokdonia sp. TaxID=575653 RepID=UPI0026289927|nr:PcfJ domain-containing protein [uncultured Dokdonia sp.]
METLYTTQTPEVTTTSKADSKYIALVEKIYNAENKPQENKGTVASLLWSSFSKMSKTRNTWKRATFKTLLIHMHTQGCYAVLRSPLFIQVLVNISTFGLKMVRPIEKWQRPSFEPEEQLEDLIDHCFAKYPTPVFLISSFYESSLRHQLWYVQLGSGKSVKSLIGLPDKFTSKMMHEFRNTPKGFSVSEAIVHAQALGYGASQQIAIELTRSKLAQIEGNIPFWTRVIQFFSVQKQVTHWELYKALEYLEVRIQRDRRFTMKGRTLEALLNQSHAWYIEMQKMRNEANYLSWFPSGIKEMHKEVEKDGKKVIYIAKELLTSEELYQEGHDMNHCVADYIDDCYAMDTSIFSLRKQEGDTIKKLATIEINPRTLEVLQAEGNCNTPLSVEATMAFNLWTDLLGINEKVIVSNQDQPIPQNPPQQVPIEQREVVEYANYRQRPPAHINDSDIDVSTIIRIILIIIKIIIVLSRLGN